MLTQGNAKGGRRVAIISGEYDVVVGLKKQKKLVKDEVNLGGKTYEKIVNKQREQ